MRLILRIFGGKTLYGWLLAVFLASLGASYGIGRSHGAETANARHALAQAASEAAERRAAGIQLIIEAERLALQAEAEAEARRLEDAAKNDPDADRIAIGSDSVSRINSQE